MFWWQNSETQERRKASRRPAGFGWILSPSEVEQTPSGPTVLEALVDTALVATVQLADEDQGAGESLVSDVFSGLGGSFGGGGATGDW